MTRARLAWNRLVFELRGGNRLNDCVDEISARGFHMLLSCALIWVVLLLVDVAFFAVRPKEGVLGIFILATSTLVALRLVRSHRTRSASILFVTTFWCVAEALSALNGGLRSGTYGLVVLIIVNAGWLLGRSSAIGLAAVTLIIALVEAMSEYFGHPLPAFFPGNPIGNWLIFVGILLFAVNPILTILETLQTQLATLRGSDDRWQLALRAINAGIWDWEASTGQVYVSPRWKEILGYEDSEISDQTSEWESRIHPEDRPRVKAELAAHLDRQTPSYQSEYRMLAKDGSYRWILARGQALWDQAGHATRLVGSHSDITESKLAAESLVQAKEAAEAANRSKGEFLANMSHEIRTPMTGVLGMIDLTLSSELGSTQRGYLETARSSAASLLGLLNEILDLSKIDAGRLELTAEVFSMRDCVHNAIQMFTVSAQQKGLSLTWDVSREVPDDIVGDPLRIRQVFVNLLGNAIKFTDAGGVAVRVMKASESGRPDRIHVEVEDTGIGIAPDKQLLVFEPFRQVDGSSTRRHFGTGLGLTISARLLKLMGGGIGLRSEPGHGSTFTFEFPLVAADPESVALSRQRNGSADSQSTLEPAIRPLRILVAEDSVVNQKVIGVLLRRDGHEVSIVSDGLEAVTAVREGVFDVVLMDVQMPIMDGFAATAAIREMEGKKGHHTSIVALTAHAMRGDEEKCLAAGMDAYLSKPIGLPALRGTLAKLMATAGDNVE